MQNLTVLQRLVILLVAWHLLQGGLPVAGKITQATYVYEKDQSFIPSPVAAAINQLNRQGIRASSHEVDTTDGTGEVPEQYKLAVPAAKEAGLPAMVFQSTDKVLKVLKAPKTDAEILEAVK